ncbi:MAG: transposase [Bryobacteraceae bacterium]
MAINKDIQGISRLEIVDTGRRRRWPDGEKLRIVEESFSGPRLASATARRHGLSKQLLFGWRKAYREGRLGSVAGFVPAVIAATAPRKLEKVDHCRVEILTANGRRVIVAGGVNVDLLLQIVRGLERLP